MKKVIKDGPLGRFSFVQLCDMIIEIHIERDLHLDWKFTHHRINNFLRILYTLANTCDT